MSDESSVSPEIQERILQAFATAQICNDAEGRAKAERILSDIIDEIAPPPEYEVRVYVREMQRNDRSITGSVVIVPKNPQ